MIYATQIQVPDRTAWGDVHVKEQLIPAKIRRITGFFANVALGDKTRLLRCEESKVVRIGGVPQYNHETYTIDGVTYTVDELQVDKELSAQPITAQVGNYSISINNTDITVDSSPLLVVNVLNKQGIYANLIKLPKPIEVLPGSFLRIAIEETLRTPFVDAAKWATLSTPDRNAYYGGDATGIVPTNNYNANIYLNYD